MKGIFLVALGSVWNEVRLPSAAKAAAYWVVLYGTCVNWLVTSLAAAFGTAAQSPISADHSGQRWQESLVAIGFLSVSISIVAASVLVLWGLRGRASEGNDSWKQGQLNISRVAEGHRS